MAAKILHKSDPNRMAKARRTSRARIPKNPRRVLAVSATWAVRHLTKMQRVGRRLDGLDVVRLDKVRALVEKMAKRLAATE